MLGALMCFVHVTLIRPRIDAPSSRSAFIQRAPGARLRSLIAWNHGTATASRNEQTYNVAMLLPILGHDIAIQSLGIKVTSRKPRSFQVMVFPGRQMTTIVESMLPNTK